MPDLSALAPPPVMVTLQPDLESRAAAPIDHRRCAY
jgi:hypothetical protein